MGWSIIKQPNGKYLVFCSITDSIIAWDHPEEAIREKVLKRYIERAKQEGPDAADRMIKSANGEGLKPAHTFVGAIAWERFVANFSEPPEKANEYMMAHEAMLSDEQKTEYVRKLNQYYREVWGDDAEHAQDCADRDTKLFPGCISIITHRPPSGQEG